MKTLLSLFALSLALCSCKVVPYANTIYSHTGRPGDIDAIRGMNDARSDESMHKYGDKIWSISGKGSYEETSPAIGTSPCVKSYYTGSARKEYFTGRKGEKRYQIAREMAFADGTGCWQGHNPGGGYYDHDWTAVELLTSDGQLIKLK